MCVCMCVCAANLLCKLQHKSYMYICIFSTHLNLFCFEYVHTYVHFFRHSKYICMLKYVRVYICTNLHTYSHMCISSLAVCQTNVCSEKTHNKSLNKILFYFDVCMSNFIRQAKY